MLSFQIDRHSDQSITSHKRFVTDPRSKASRDFRHRDSYCVRAATTSSKDNARTSHAESPLLMAYHNAAAEISIGEGG
jgi:hypothetical protein